MGGIRGQEHKIQEISTLRRWALCGRAFVAKYTPQHADESTAHPGVHNTAGWGM
jgi:hypothetical protein